MRKKYMGGFSLIEIMIALVISLVLTAGVLSVLSSSKRTYTLQSELASLQESARFLVDDIANAARMAGYFGCSGIPLIQSPAIVGENDKEIKGFLEDDTGTLTADSSNERLSVLPASDILTVTYYQNKNRLLLPYDSKRNPNEIVDPAAVKAAIAQVEGTEGWGIMGNNIIPLANDSLLPQAGEVIIISDCGGASTYTVDSVATNAAAGSFRTMTISPGLTRRYYWPMEIFIQKGTQVTYEVGGIDNNSNGSTGDPEDGFALFKTTNGVREQFIDGVQNMQVRYGVDKGLNSIMYSSNSTEMGTIVSLRITLLMRTPNRQDALGLPEDWNGEDDSYVPILDPQIKYNPSDSKYVRYETGYRHRIFISTINVRNSGG